MRLKQKPEDFSVKESYRFDPVEGGTFRVYMMDKQKVSTFDAITRIRERFGLKPGSVSYCGLKDKQGRTEQLVAVDGRDIDMQDPDLRLKFLGLTDHPLTAANTTSNRFSVTVRAVRTEELPQLNIAAAEVNRLGVVNYFDDQRFGSLKHGQGFIAKDLLRGDFEGALRNFMAVPSELDRSDDAKVKKFWSENWGDWTARCPFEGNKKYFRILKSLRDKPTDFVAAFLQIDSDYRAMQLFTFQSYLWNEGARRLLQLMMPREHLFPMRYQAGTLLHHKDATPEVLQRLRSLTFPLLSPLTQFHDEQVKEAAIWALGKEKLTLEQLRVEAAPKLLYLKHEERPLLVYPHKLVIGRPEFDELNRPYNKVNVAFTLPPGSYATLVVKRLFHFAPSESGETVESRQAFDRRNHEDDDEGEADRGRDAGRGGPRKDRYAAGPRGERSGGPRTSNGPRNQRDSSGPRSDSPGGGERTGGRRFSSGPRRDGPGGGERSGGQRYSSGPRRDGSGGGDRPGGTRFSSGPRRDGPGGGERPGGKRFPSGPRRDGPGGAGRSGGPRNERYSSGPRREGSSDGESSSAPRSAPYSNAPRGDASSGGERSGRPRNERYPSGPRREGPAGGARSGGPRNERYSSGPRRESSSGGARSNTPHFDGESTGPSNPPAQRSPSPPAAEARPFKSAGGKRPGYDRIPGAGGPPRGKRPFKPRKFQRK